LFDHLIFPDFSTLFHFPIPRHTFFHLSIPFLTANCRHSKPQIKKATQNKLFFGAFFQLLFYHSKKLIQQLLDKDKQMSPATSRCLHVASAAPKSLLRVASAFLFGKQLLRKQLNPYSEEQKHEPKSSNDHR